jgi:hypothetical protein
MPSTSNTTTQPDLNRLHVLGLALAVIDARLERLRCERLFYRNQQIQLEATLRLLRPA